MYHSLEKKNLIEKAINIFDVAKVPHKIIQTHQIELKRSHLLKEHQLLVLFLISSQAKEVSQQTEWKIIEMQIIMQISSSFSCNYFDANCTANGVKGTSERLHEGNTRE